eukprot:scaffold3924_cov109-Cylindrotheca_fusiformis.AAC.3
MVSVVLLRCCFAVVGYLSLFRDYFNGRLVRPSLRLAIMQDPPKKMGRNKSVNQACLIRQEKTEQHGEERRNLLKLKIRICSYTVFETWDCTSTVRHCAFIK